MTVVCLKRSGAARPIVVSLDVEACVYLYSVDIVSDRSASTRLLSRERTASSATWTDLISFDEDSRDVRIGVRWVAMNSAAPGRRYKAVLSVRDESGALAPVKAGYANPVAISGRIGPAADPTDERRVSIVIA